MRYASQTGKHAAYRIRARTRGMARSAKSQRQYRQPRHISSLASGFLHSRQAVVASFAGTLLSERGARCHAPPLAGCVALTGRRASRRRHTNAAPSLGARMTLVCRVCGAPIRSGALRGLRGVVESCRAGHAASALLELLDWACVGVCSRRCSALASPVLHEPALLFHSTRAKSHTPSSPAVVIR